MSRRAATLIEVLVAGTISLLIGTILIVAFAFMGNALTRHSRHSEAQRNVLMAINAAKEICRAANRNSLLVNPSWFSLASWQLPDGSLSFSPNAEVQWVAWNIVYFDSVASQVKIQRIAITPPVAYLLPLQRTAFTATTNDRPLASGITAFECSRVAPSSLRVKVVSEVYEARSVMQTQLVPCSSQTDPDAAPTN